MREPVQLLWELLWIPVTCGYGLCVLALTAAEWLKGRKPDDELLERYDLNGLSGIVLVLVLNSMIWLSAYCALDGVHLFGLKDNLHGMLAGGAMLPALYLAGRTGNRITRVLSLLVLSGSVIPLILLERSSMHAYDCLILPALVALALGPGWLRRKAAVHAEVRQ